MPDSRARALAVQITDEQDYLAIDIIAIRRLAEQVLAREGNTDAGEVSITFVDVETIAKLNSKYRGVGEATDVLSFSMVKQDEEGPFVSPVAILGDVVVCPEVAARNAEILGRTATYEIMEMVIHGLLHLLGYTHDADKDEANMFERQEELAALIIAGKP